MSTPSYTLTNDSLTVILGGKSYSIRKGGRNFDAARQAVLAEQWDVLPPLLSAGLAIERWLDGRFKVADGFITYDGEKVDPALNKRMLKMAEEGVNPAGWLKFWARLQANPSYRSVHQLYAFLAHEGIPIGESDGHLLIYKSVTRDYRDHHSGTFDNRPGITNEMPRNKISDDPNVACHEGFHVGALAYAMTFGTDKRIIICKVDPADVVCVPFDSSAMKVRVCRYTVVGNYSGEPLPDTTFRDDEDVPPLDPPSPPPLNVVADVQPVDDVKARMLYEMEIVAERVEEQATVAMKAMKARKKAASPVVAPWAAYDAMGMAELDQVLFPDLRKYARHHLLIIGASKMKGTKHDLVLRILEVRSKGGRK